MVTGLTCLGFTTTGIELCSRSCLILLFISSCAEEGLLLMIMAAGSPSTLPGLDLIIMGLTLEGLAD